ncbi:MAG: hypothetical protein GYB36_05030 [Alphaproteobacteria bacterium]|nr:hypothetical protein [Alphaproteobacteria bacterium]
MTWGGENVALLWDAQSGEVLERFDHFGLILGASFTPDGDGVLTWGGARAQLWDKTSGVIEGDFSHYPYLLWTADLSPDGHALTTTGEGRARLWDVGIGSVITEYHGTDWSEGGR